MAEPSQSGSGRALTFFGGLLLLLCALLGLLFSFLTLYGFPAVPAGPAAALCALFALISAGAWSLPRRAPAAGGALAAGWVLAALYNWNAFTRGGTAVVARINDIFSRSLGWSLTVDLTLDLTPLQRAEAVNAFLLLAAALLALLLGWAILRARRWVPVVLLTLPPLLPGLLCDLFPSWLPFMALTACWCAMLLTALCAGAAANRRGALTLAALGASALLLGLLTLLMPMEGYSGRPQWALDTEAAMVELGDRIGPWLRGVPGPFHAPDRYEDALSPLELDEAGPLHYTGLPVLRVTTGYSGHLYLRAGSLALYTGTAWEPLPEGTWQEYADSLPDGAWEGSPLLFPALHTRRQVWSATVENLNTSGVFLPGQPVDQDWEALGLRPEDDSHFSRLRGQDSHSVDFTAWPDGQAAPTAALAPEEARAERAYRDFVYGHYLDVPEQARQAIEEALGLYLSSRDYTTMPPPIQLVPGALAALYRYDRDTPLPPEGADFVSWFLGEGRRGYCVHFASAGVLMFRYMGIPARYVSGYTVGCRGTGSVLVPDSAAHAWVEIYVNGYGWYPVEVTPGYGEDDPGPEESGPAAPSAPPEESEPLPESLPPEPSQPPSSPPAPSGEAQAEASPALRSALRALAAVILAAGGLWLFQFLLKHRRRAAFHGPDPGAAVLCCYRSLCRMEPWGGKVPPGVRELAEKAVYSTHALTGEERLSALAAFEGERRRLLLRLTGLRRLSFLYLWGGSKAPAPPKQ